MQRGRDGPQPPPHPAPPPGIAHLLALVTGFAQRLTYSVPAQLEPVVSQVTDPHDCGDDEYRHAHNGHHHKDDVDVELRDGSLGVRPRRTVELAAFHDRPVEEVSERGHHHAGVPPEPQRVGPGLSAAHPGHPSLDECH